MNCHDALSAASVPPHFWAVTPPDERTHQSTMAATEEDLAAAKVQAMIRGRSSRKSLPPREVAAQPCLVVTGPGGLDKHKLVRQLVANYGDEFARPVSHTTRAPRKGEVHGVDYFFISFERMKTLIGRGLFAEHTEVGA